MPQPPTPPETTPPDLTQYLTGPAVCRRYGIVLMTLWRWLQEDDYRELNFPEPAFVIKGRRYWDKAKLIEWERASAASRGATSPPQRRRGAR